MRRYGGWSLIFAQWHEERRPQSDQKQDDHYEQDHPNRIALGYAGACWDISSATRPNKDQDNHNDEKYRDHFGS
jgi:hypothetical protein